MSSPSARPTPLQVLPDNIPAELKDRRQWVLWRYTWSAVKNDWDKPPLTRSGYLASSTDPSTWCSFEEAVAAYEAGGFDGIGYVFTKDDEFSGIDLDDCRDPATGELLSWTAEQRESLPMGFPVPQDIVRGAASYFEASPSGTGVKGIVRAITPKGTRMGPVEIYPHGRYFTITGHRLDAASVDIRDAQPFIDAVVARIELKRSAKTTKPKGKKSTTAVQPVADDPELLAVAFTARNGTKVRDLFEGRWQTYFPASAGPSEADLALCSELAFWTGPDAARIDRLFRQSALFRDKWDDVHNGEGRTYGEMTIAAALASKADFYDWSRKEKQAAAPPMVELGPFRLLPRSTRETAGGKIVVGVDVLRDGEVVHFLNASSSNNGRKEAVWELLRFLPADQQEAAVAERAVDEVLVLGRKQMLEAPKGRTGNTIIDLLLVEVPRRWKLTHRDQQGLWSETLGRSINRSTLLELVVCSEILGQAAECADAPQDARGEVQLDKLQALVEKLAKVVYADLVGLLPPLDRAEITEDNGARIRQALKTAILDAWMRPQIMGIVRRQTTDNDSVQLADRTSLAQRVRKEAFHVGAAGELEICGPLAWSQVQSGHSAWWRVFQPEEGPPQVWLAMRFDLFPATHINLASYGIYDQASLTNIGRKLGLLAIAPPIPETIGHQKTRVAVLAADLVPEIVFDTSEESRPAGAKRPAPAA